MKYRKIIISYRRCLYLQTFVNIFLSANICYRSSNDIGHFVNFKDNNNRQIDRILTIKF